MNKRVLELEVLNALVTAMNASAAGEAALLVRLMRAMISTAGEGPVRRALEQAAKESKS